MISSTSDGAPVGQGIANALNHWGANMLTSQSNAQVYNTQVYSLFGSYVVEQHGDGIDGFRGYPERDRPHPLPATQKELPKAA